MGKEGGQKNKKFCWTTADRNLPSFAEFGLKLRVLYVPGPEVVQANILQLIWLIKTRFR